MAEPVIIVQSGFSFWQFITVLVAAVASGSLTQYFLRRSDRKTVQRALLAEIKYLIKRLQSNYDQLGSPDPLAKRGALHTLRFDAADVAVFKDNKSALGSLPILLADRIVNAYSRLMDLHAETLERTQQLMGEGLNFAASQQRIRVLLTLKSFESAQQRLIYHTTDTIKGRVQVRLSPLEFWLRAKVPKLLRKRGVRSIWVRRAHRLIPRTGAVRVRIDPDRGSAR
jgi:hypothetical protein